MRELTWRFNRARIWLDELPDWKYEVAQVEEQHLPVCGRRKKGLRSAAIEMVLPVGPMAMYGALGATFLAEPGEDLRIQVLVSPNQGDLYLNTLVGKSDKVHAGLPKEYVKGLLSTVSSFQQTQLLGTGTVSFCRSLHGERGSSVRLFQMISTALIRLFCLENHSLSDGELFDLLFGEKSK